MHGKNYLTSKKREELSSIFDRLKKELDEKKSSLKKIYEKYIPETSNFQKKTFDESLTNSIQLYFSFYFFGPLFSIFNLIGIYQSIGIMKTIFEEIKQQSWILLKNKILNSKTKEKKEKSFYDNYINQNFNQILDINLMMITSFIGIILMQYKGYKFKLFLLFFSIHFLFFYFLYLTFLIYKDFYKLFF